MLLIARICREYSTLTQTAKNATTVKGRHQEFKRFWNGVDGKKTEAFKVSK